MTSPKPKLGFEFGARTVSYSAMLWRLARLSQKRLKNKRKNLGPSKRQMLSSKTLRWMSLPRLKGLMLREEWVANGTRTRFCNPFRSHFGICNINEGFLESELKGSQCQPTNNFHPTGPSLTTAAQKVELDCQITSPNLARGC